MWHRHSGAGGASDLSGLALRDIWDVRADRSYDVHCSRSASRIVAIRTLAGTGRLDFDHVQTTDVHGGSLVFVEWPHLRRYRCLGRRWDFWWFAFQAGGPPAFPLYQVLQIPAQQRDKEDLQAAFTALRRDSFAQRSYASSIAAMMFQRWLCSWRGSQRRSRHQETVDAVIDEMHERLRDGWPVAEMARSAGMSVRSFRDAFRAATGRSPKAYYDVLRLNTANQLLRLGLYSVGEVADQLGFSSPFHLSRAFRRHFGMPPSRVTSD